MLHFMQMCCQFRRDRPPAQELVRALGYALADFNDCRSLDVLR
jgi:hypothetical protein